MHHIGYSRSCPSKDFVAWNEKLSEAKKTAYIWLGAFGEGYAVLAAANGLDKDPQASAADDVRKDWANGMSHQNEQFKQVEAFFTDVLDGKIDSFKARE